MNQKTNRKNRTIVLLGMLTAISYILSVVIHIPMFADYLTYTPSDVPVAIAGFVLGPPAAVFVAFAESFIEGITISHTGFIGGLMNFISTIGFAGTAGLVYKKYPSTKGMVLGLGLGMAAMTILMLLWNYGLTPIYLGVPRNVVAGMLVPVFLPFNLVKSGLNAIFTFFLYKALKHVL